MKLEVTYVDLYKLFNKLHKERVCVANNLSKKIIEELKELNMPKANFVVNFSDLPTLDDCKFNSSNGEDKVEFLFSKDIHD